MICPSKHSFIEDFIWDFPLPRLNKWILGWLILSTARELYRRNGDGSNSTRDTYSSPSFHPPIKDRFARNMSFTRLRWHCHGEMGKFWKKNKHINLVGGIPTRWKWWIFPYYVSVPEGTRIKTPKHGLSIWLVVYLPLWKIWVRQLGWLFPIYGKS